MGGHIHYQIGISLDDKQKEYWNLYTAENREKYFWLFLNSFVEKWEQKVNYLLFCETCDITRYSVYYDDLMVLRSLISPIKAHHDITKH